MTSLRGWKIRPLLAMVFAAVLLPVLIAIAVAAIELVDLRRQAADIHDDMVADREHGSEVGLAVAKALEPVRDHVFGGDPGARARFEDARKALRAALDRVERLGQDDVRAGVHVERLRQLVSEMERLGEAALALPEPAETEPPSPRCAAWTKSRCRRPRRWSACTSPSSARSRRTSRRS